MQYTGMMLLEEMASIFLTPYLLVFVVPKVCTSICSHPSIYVSKGIPRNTICLILQRVDDILKFIKDFTVDVEGVGHVCRFVLVHRASFPFT